MNLGTSAKSLRRSGRPEVAAANGCHHDRGLEVALRHKTSAHRRVNEFGTSPRAAQSDTSGGGRGLPGNLRPAHTLPSGPHPDHPPTSQTITSCGQLSRSGIVSPRPRLTKSDRLPTWNRRPVHGLNHAPG
jgi:hypothetical protein